MEAVMELVTVEPIEFRYAFCHFNRGSEPHSFEESKIPVYPEYADGQRLKSARRRLRLGIREASQLLGLSALDYSCLERGRKILAAGEDMDKVIERLGKHK
jgi:hypothetical protein